MRRPIIAVLLIGLIITAIASAAYGYQRTKALEGRLIMHLHQGQVALEAGKAELKIASTNRDVQHLSSARAHFAHATASFQLASGDARNSSLLRVGTAVPGVNLYVGPRAKAVELVADLGTALSDAASKAADIDELLLAPSANGDEGSAKLVGVLRASAPLLDQIRADLGRASSDASRIDIRVLPAGQQAALLSARTAITKGVTGTNEFATLIPVLSEIMGVNGARTYLIEQLNPAELRPGGGFIGTYSLMIADQGTLKLAKTGDIKTLDFPRPDVGQPGFVKPPDPLRQLIGQSSWSLEDSNFEPDFATDAKSAELFASRSLNTKIDGVLALDFYAVAGLLKITGPIAVPSENFTVTADNLVPEIIRRDEVDPAHKQFLAQIAGPLLTRVAGLPANRWPELVATLNDIAVARHLQAYFNTTQAEAEMDRIGWSGALNPSESREFMMSVETNLSASKANFWMERSFEVNLTRGGDRLHHEVKIHLINRTPVGYLGAYVCYYRLYLPADSASVKTTGLRANAGVNLQASNGLRVTDGWIDMPAPSLRVPNPTWDVAVSYDTPWSPDSSGQEKIYWQKQAGTGADKVSLTWADAARTYKANGDLSQDRVIRIGAGGLTLESGQAATARLPSLSL